MGSESMNLGWMPTTEDMPQRLQAAKRTNIYRSEDGDNWWMGHGKDESCFIEGTANHWFWLAFTLIGLTKADECPYSEDAPLPYSKDYVCDAVKNATAKDAEIERLKEYSKGAFQHRHELYCNANHNELPGGDACSCPAGKEIKRLRKALSDQVGVNRELRYSPITDGTINVGSLRQELAEAREKNRRINDNRNKLLSQLAASEEKRKVLGEEVNFIRHMFDATEEEGTLVWTNCDNDILEEYGQLKDATDAAKAMEGA